MKGKELVARTIFFSAALLSASAGLFVLGFMVVLGLPVLESGMLLPILTDPWSPDHGQFGIIAMIVGTVYIAGLSILFSFPVSLGTAVFIEVIRPDGPGRVMSKLVRPMTAIPTVIYGFVGGFLLVPVVRNFGAQAWEF